MIYTDISFLFEHKTGIGTYTDILLDCLKRDNREYKCLKLNLPYNIKWKSLWHFIWLDTVVFAKCLINKPDILLLPDFFMPHILCKHTRYLTVIHDMCTYREGEVPKNFAAFNRHAVRNAVKNADTVITVSNTVKNELINFFDISPDRVKVVYNGVSKHFINSDNNPEIIDKYGIEKNKYILSVATLDKRKNIPELTKAYTLIADKYPDIKLVLVGGAGNENKEKLVKHPNIILTGYITDKELPELYKNALFYMYPSLYEGFGIPQIEAQYCGCPLLCSDIPVFREVSGDCAEFCTPTADEIASSMEKLINNPERLNELREKGFENVKRFMPDEISKQFSEVING